MRYAAPKKFNCPLCFSGEGELLIISKHLENWVTKDKYKCVQKSSMQLCFF